MALAYLLDPVADRLERGGMSRFWATITIVLITVLVCALLVLIVRAAARLAARRLPRAAAVLCGAACRRW